MNLNILLIFFIKNREWWGHVSISGESWYEHTFNCDKESFWNSWQSEAGNKHS